MLGRTFWIRVSMWALMQQSVSMQCGFPIEQGLFFYCCCDQAATYQRDLRLVWSCNPSSRELHQLVCCYGAARWIEQMKKMMVCTQNVSAGLAVPV